MIWLLVLLVLGDPPQPDVQRFPTVEACQAAAMARADVELRQRRRVWFTCLDVATQ